MSRGSVAFGLRFIHLKPCAEASGWLLQGNARLLEAFSAAVSRDLLRQATGESFRGDGRRQRQALQESPERFSARP